MNPTPEDFGATDTPSGQRPLLKGRQTRAAILDAALALASQNGLQGLSIGVLAEVTQMSKSGVFAHFGSREGLQIAVVREYHARFEEEVFQPAMAAARGLPRLRTLFDRWFKRVSVEVDAGCLYISGAVEFDDRPGPVRDALVAMVETWQTALERAIRLAIDEGHLRADTDTRQVLFEVHGLTLALHHDARFLRHPGADVRARRAFENVLSHYIADASPRPVAAPVKHAAGGAVRRLPESRLRLSCCCLLRIRCSSIHSGFHFSGVSMPQYTPPLRDMQFLMHEVLNVVDELKLLPAHADIDADTINAVLEEGGKFAASVILPINQVGDEEGCVLDQATHEVTAPKGLQAGLCQYVEGGWPSLSCDPAFGGQGLPHLVNQCFFEMLNSANQAWTMYPGLSHGAYEALVAHGSDAQKQMYLPKLVSGEWTGTMCLTESQLRHRPRPAALQGQPQPDGSYKITGNKIFNLRRRA